MGIKIKRHLNMRLLIATTNKGKIQMYRDLLRGESVDFVFLDEIGNSIPSPEENGATPEENAILKARFYCEKIGLPALADDAGFAIDALNGKPGVMARRWGGELPDSISDEDWLTFYQKKVETIQGERFPGSFPFSRAIAFPNGKIFAQNDKIEILLIKKPRRPFKEGFPISSVHVFPDGRHNLDVPADDPIREGHYKKEGLMDLLKRAGF